MTQLPHLSASGEVHIVDVGGKDRTRRVAIAEGRILMQPATARAVLDQQVSKGDVLAVARIAGLMAAKRTAEIVPLCHPISLTHAEVVIVPLSEDAGFLCRAETVTVERTGVEMEALHAVQAALLTIYDMCKSVDRGMEMNGIRLLHKSGGRSGTWDRNAAPE